MFYFLKYHCAQCLLLLLGFAVSASGQQPKEEKEYNGRLSKAFIKAPMLLVNGLTKNKETETEKFEAIYSWVVKNIDYDYGVYFSAGGVGTPQLKSILKNRRGVCLDYAYLMDTLCYMAGITNASIYGYAKDELFDVNDSLYIDNHAWNAVRLDNLWYLYDVTWSKGYTYYRYTKFSQFIVNLKKRFTIKYVAKTVKQKRRRYFRKLTCGSFVAIDSAEHNVTIYKQVYKHKLLRRLLSLFRLKIIRSYKEELNTRFYLADPKVFAITHFPDDPDWSLLPQQGIRTFECDSAYYHLSDTVYKTQQRRGWSCYDCLNDLSLSALDKNMHLRKKSLALNPRNRFITSLCEYNIGGIKFEESRPVEDSLAKVTILDTSLAYMEQARLSLMKASRNIDAENYMQALKNRKKLSDLHEDNSRHQVFIRSKMETSFRETKNLRDLENKINMYGSKFYFRNRTIHHYKHGRNIDRDAHRVLSTIEYVSAQVQSKTKQIDSLNALISTLKTSFDSLLPGLKNSLWRKVINHDSLILPLQQSMAYRIKMLDNYKKKIVEVRKEMYVFEKNYSDDLDSSVYKPGDFCYETGSRIFSLIDVRNRESYECYKLKCQLVKFRELEPEDLDAYRQSLLDENERDLCWIRGNGTYLQGIFYGFKALLYKQHGFDKMLESENLIEGDRYRRIDYELNRRKRKYQNIVSSNRIAVNVRNREIKKDKAAFLNKLRKERREAMKNLKTN